MGAGEPCPASARNIVALSSKSSCATLTRLYFSGFRLLVNYPYSGAMTAVSRYRYVDKITLERIYEVF